jgi:hypothetical protein
MTNLGMWNGFREVEGMCWNLCSPRQMSRKVMRGWKARTSDSGGQLLRRSQVRAGPLLGQETLTTEQGLRLEFRHYKVLLGSVLEVVLLDK